jgi:hypothetical protein
MWGPTSWSSVHYTQVSPIEKKYMIQRDYFVNRKVLNEYSQFLLSYTNYYMVILTPMHLPGLGLPSIPSLISDKPSNKTERKKRRRPGNMSTDGKYKQRE